MTLRRRTLLFAAYTLCVAGFNAGVIRALLGLSLRDATSSHLVLVPFVTLALIYLSRDSIFAIVRPARLDGAGLIVVGVGLSLTGRLLREGGTQEAQLTVLVGGLAVLWAGGFVLFYGRAAARAALFPLLFLGFMIPIPRMLLDGATLFLKTGSREAVAGLFTLTGTPYYREGFTFSLPKFAIEIADACSGIRSTIALLLTSLLAGHIFLRTGWKKAVLVAAIFPVTVLKNGIRIVTLSLLAAHVDPGFLTGQLHHEGGIVFYFLALVLLSPIFGALRRSESRVLRADWRLTTESLTRSINTL